MVEEIPHMAQESQHHLQWVILKYLFRMLIRIRHRHGRTKHRRCSGHLPSRTKSKLKWLTVLCCPPLPEKYVTKIASGEYISFDKLTIPEKHQEKHTTKPFKKVVSGLSSWLEAWNKYTGVVVALNPSRALEMLNYQTLVTTAFRDYPAEACIE